MSTIRQSDPGAGYFAHKEEIDAAVARVLASGRYILGEEVSAFEAEWAKFLGVAHVIGTGNGTDALELALRAFGIGAGDVVITTANTAVATVAAIELTGASALLVDVDEDSLTLSCERLEEALRQNTNGPVKAIVPVHLFGQPAAMQEIGAIAADHGLMVLEDCAQAHGSAIDAQMVGSFGDAAAFSFYPTKNLGALGDAGAVVTRDAALAEKTRSLRVYGWRHRYISESAGINSRLDDLQAAILRAKLQHLQGENARRHEIVQRYYHSLASLPLKLPTQRPGERHAFHQFVIRLPQRDALRAHLSERGIETAILYPVPIHQQPAYQGRVGVSAPLPVTERAAGELLCLPMHPWLSDDDVTHVCEAIIDWCNR